MVIILVLRNIKPGLPTTPSLSFVPTINDFRPIMCVVVPKGSSRKRLTYESKKRTVKVITFSGRKGAHIRNRTFHRVFFNATLLYLNPLV